MCNVQNICATYSVQNFSLELSYLDCENGCVVKWKETSDSQRFNCILIDKSILIPNYTEVCSDAGCIPFIGRLKLINSSSITNMFSAHLEFTNFTTSTCPFLKQSMRNGRQILNNEIEITKYCYICSLNVSSSPHTIFTYAQLSAATDNHSAPITELSLGSCGSTYIPLSTTSITGK